jgi:hypothetical protein
VVRVPRKASLQVLGLPRGAGGRVTVSLFPLRSPSFRAPLFEKTVGAEWTEVPSGELIVALTGQGAPDLQRLLIPPAARVQVTYRAREGWSLLVRCRPAAAGGRGVVAGAAVSVEGRTEATGPDGLALFPGLAGTVAATAAHPGFLTGKVEGITAEPGTLVAYDVPLELGGTVRARVTLDGRPAAEAFCTLLDPEVRGGALAEAAVGADGVCRSGRVKAGTYTLRVAVPASRTYVDETVAVREGSDSAVDVRLSSIRVSGRVLVGGRPAAGYRVEADIAAGSHVGLPVLQATTDENGDYQATVWLRGEYIFRVTAPSGRILGSQRKVDLERREEGVDFELE